MTRLIISAPLAALLLAACAGGTVDADARPPFPYPGDAAPADAPMVAVDAAGIDAAQPGAPDAAGPDAGVPDAGVPDASIPDAAPAADAAPITGAHLLLTELVAAPSDQELIEIFNPTPGTVDLTDYYLSDDSDYALVPGLSGTGPEPALDTSDFIVRFPSGASIAPGQVVTVALSADGFATAFGADPDFAVGTAGATTAQLMISIDLGATAGITNSGEHVVLFSWDGASDLVADVDMAYVGAPTVANGIAAKTAVSVDGPDADATPTTYAADANTMPLPASDVATGLSTKRLRVEDGHETMAAGGNGITGDDETSEDISITWTTTYTAPTPGVIEL